MTRARPPKRKPPLKVAIGQGEALQFTPEQVDHVIEDLMREGQLLLVVYRKGSDLGCLVLGDPNPAIPGILEFLNRRHQVPVEVVDPFKRIQFDPALFSGNDPKVIGPSLTVGIGLALRKVDDR